MQVPTDPAPTFRIYQKSLNELLASIHEVW